MEGGIGDIAIDGDYDLSSGNFWSANIPRDAMNSDLIDSITAKEMSKLSIQDRENAYMDVHGVPDTVKETPEFVDRGLDQMEREINLINKRDAYDLAESIDPEYTKNRDFRLAFLRTDLFDSRLAALRIVGHFEMKLDLFGMEKLAMDITQDDLNMKDMDLLYSGYGRILDCTDRAGRIVYLTVTPQKDFPPISMLRRGFYNLMVSARNPIAQKRGAVLVGYFVGTQHKSSVYWKLPKVTQSVPVRTVATHLCCSNSLWRPVHALIKTSFNIFSRMRIRTHYGSQAQCLASLQGHGIEPTIFPLDSDGNLTSLEAYRQALLQQRIEERLNHPHRSTLFVPGMNDVLFGKGMPVQNHAGNKILRRLVVDSQKNYEKAKKGAKILLAQEIVDLVYQSGGMFLKPDNDSWIAVDNDAARTKVSTAFRTLRMDQRKIADMAAKKEKLAITST